VKKQAVANSKKIGVTFEAPADIQAETVAVVGDFNNWDPNATPMKRKKDGSWSATLRLAPATYRFRYVADGKKFFNDPEADGTEPSGFGEDNCILRVG
jgi:1,4-alpha-glucan branching enzyme